MYAAETWTLTQADRSKLEAFEMWIWKKMEKISWVAKKTNEAILNTVQQDRKKLNTIWCRSHKWIYSMLDCCMTYWKEGCCVEEQEVEEGYS